MIQTAEPLARLRATRVLVTGASGSIGNQLVEELELAGVDVLASDLPTVDVRRPFQSDRDLLFHLAAAKHAPHGEDDPWEVTETNVLGTRHALAAGPRVVLASTCKACDPETAYGASKLIAERMTLNAGGSVARFYNVPESSGNVFRLWETIPDGEPLPVTDCARYFIGVHDAVALLLWAAVLPPGRYIADPGTPRWMADVARELYPGRRLQLVPRRRGDRKAEPMLAAAEAATRVSSIPRLLRVESPHDEALAGAACPACLDTGAVCENHPDLPWEGTCVHPSACRCGGAGMPCPACCSPVPYDGAHSAVEAFTPDRLRA